MKLVGCLTDRLLHEQHSELMSPLVWDLGHMGDFEAMWLLEALGEAAPASAYAREVYDPFRNPRATRGTLEKMDLGQALAYLEEVRAEVLARLDEQSFRSAAPLLEAGYVYRMVEQHEAQHVETMLQSLDLYATDEGHSLAGGYFCDTASHHSVQSVPMAIDDEATVPVRGGQIAIGTGDRRWAYDNERPRFELSIADFEIDRYPVTCRRFAEFIADGGYANRRWWSEPGWAWRNDASVEAPQGWTACEQFDGEWGVLRFGSLQRLDLREPVQHVCYFEAQAFASWSEARLPNEFEWELAAAPKVSWGELTSSQAQYADDACYPWGQRPAVASLANLRFSEPQAIVGGPMPVGSYPAGASAFGVEQMLGDVYEWTSSDFLGYPGFEAFPYPEYSEVFFGEQYKVLRGASWATAPCCARVSFRNWDYPIRRQIFAGFRLAWD
jgi:iron(II)-dependent oxidoreductase